ncbi:hypothetical protein DPMN_037746 [Dreissena polymorpha]|uniref:Uncharacterized protein n=1 Tax=Dreissena polymorpha TaxID=45954 RepID=A0A9D4RMK8_DREPO|nr:hypothetical protein DPMN_037746 [Dreissena polymorpha]
MDGEHANGSGSSSVNLIDCSTRPALHSRHLNKQFIARSSSADHPTPTGTGVAHETESQS